MDNYGVYKDIQTRMGGGVYIGCVGPVRTGKSTMISKLMELLVLPGAAEGPEKARMVDDIPQSGSGRTIMTTQPKFVPAEPAVIGLNDGSVSLKVRMVDCVGYMVNGALGVTEDDSQRMVSTPWYDHDIPFEQAAEIGTRKVIHDHSTIGLVVTTDGTIADIPRDAYREPEERVINELLSIGKPFVVVVNTTRPDSQEAEAQRADIEKRYGVPAVTLDVKNMSLSDVNALMTKALFEFPVTQVNFAIPSWLGELEEDHWILGELISGVKEAAKQMSKVSDHEKAADMFGDSDALTPPMLHSIDLSTGAVNYDMALPRSLFYRVLGERCGQIVDGDKHLMSLMNELVYAKREYDRVAEALRAVRDTGYGLVPPIQEELALEEPELIKQNGKFGVRLKASAPSLHMIRVDIQTEVTPIIGSEKQSEDLVGYIMERFENDPAMIWDTDLFGKSLNDLVKEGLSTKLMRMPEDAQVKMRETLQRIINNGNGGLICILL